ncbi:MULTISPECIES: hypothetical protein [unclassified Sinorhizobium]|uniref:hypothetical protein n=1 Tax=unclassified Sinorhizobium TaxID=2613772 RepID=UPI00352647D7
MAENEGNGSRNGLPESVKWYRNRDDWMKLVLQHPDLTADQKVIGIFLAMSTSRKHPQASPQQTTIAEAIGVRVLTVKRAVKKLVDLELIKKEQVERGKRSRSVNRYRLILPSESF